MKLGKYTGYAILTFLIGFLIMFFLAGIFGQTGDGPITSSVFNSGVMGLISAILFLCSVIVVCTLLIINTINNKKES